MNTLKSSITSRQADNMSEMASTHLITTLPDDMLYEILTYAGVFASVTMGATCKSLQSVSKSDVLWKHHLTRRHPLLVDDNRSRPPCDRNPLNTGARRRWEDAISTLRCANTLPPLSVKDIYKRLHQEQAELTIPLRKMIVYDGTTCKKREEHRPIGCCLEYRGRLCPPDEMDICGHSVSGFHCAVEGCGMAYCNDCANGTSLVAGMSTTTKITNKCCTVCGVYCCYHHRNLMITSSTKKARNINSTLCIDCFNDRHVDGEVAAGGEMSDYSESESDYTSGYTDDDWGLDYDDSDGGDDYSD